MTVQAAPQRAVIYVRLSSHREDDPSLSPRSQEDACRHYADAHGWEVVEVVQDLDLSGTDKGMRLERPGLAGLLSRLDEFDVIIARDLSRFSRSVVDFLSLVERVNAAGVSLVCLKENVDLSSASGRMLATILAAFGQMEAEATGERVAMHRAAAAKLGRYAGGQPAYGYKRATGDDGMSILVPNPDEVRVIERAVDLILEDRVSLYRAMVTLNEEGLKPRKAARWTSRTLKGVLTNPSLRGYIIHRGEVVRDESGIALQPYEPVVSADDWERLQATIVNSPAKGPRRKRSGLLSGIAVCGLCGGVLHVAVSNGRKLYRCNGRSIGRDCAGTSVQAAMLDDHLSGEYLSRFGLWPEVKRVERRQDVAGLAEVIEAINATAEQMKQPGADILTLAQRMHTLAEKRAELSREVENTVEDIPTGRTIAEAWSSDDTTDDYRRILLSPFIERVTLAKGKRGGAAPAVLDTSRVAIEWREGGEPAGWDYDA